MAERPFQPVPNTPLVADPTGDAIWKRWLQGLQRFLGDAVRGPGSSTDNAVARWDGTTGTFLNNSGVIIDDSNNVSGIVNLTTTGNTILGDASADTLTLNAGTWTYGANWTATRAAGALVAGTVNITTTIESCSGDSGGTTAAVGSRNLLQVTGSNALDTARAFFQVTQHQGSATITTLQAIRGTVTIESTGGATGLFLYSGQTLLSGGGNVGTLINFSAEKATITSGAVTSHYAFNCENLGGASVTTAIGLRVQDFTASTTMTGVDLGLSAGSGKKNINVTGTADNSLAGPLYLAQDGKTQQTAAAIYAGTGAPNNANGNNGDFYMRGDGTVAGNNVMYHKEAGAWVAFTTT